MSPTDTYRDAFLKFISEGKTYAEALEEFDEEEFSQTALVELLGHEARIDFLTHEFKTNDERRLPALFSLLCRAQFERANNADFEEQAVPLMMAGWTSEVPSCYRNNNQSFWRQCPTMSLYWRAPSKRPGKPGRLYRSTSQAYNAMKRS